jgi:hypothetical protein
MLVALLTNDLELMGTAELVLDRLTPPYIRQDVDGLDMVFERIPGRRRFQDDFLPMYRALNTFMTTNFRRVK